MWYRKKPLAVEAFKWTGDRDQLEDPIWAIEAIKQGTIYFEGPKENPFRDSVVMLIITREGIMQVNHGDYVIRGIKNEIYPCKPDVFEATYDKLGD